VFLCCLTILIRLSHGIGLNWFKNIVLVTTSSDSYIPSYSSNIQITSKAEEDEEVFYVL